MRKPYKRKKTGPKKVLRCKCGCSGWFTPKRKTQVYMNLTHRNRAAQQRLRQRAKKYYDMRSEQYGGLGAVTTP